jgi:hypothetical protein
MDSKERAINRKKVKATLALLKSAQCDNFRVVGPAIWGNKVRWKWPKGKTS